MDDALRSKRMSESDWRRIEPLVDAALESPPERREATIQELCHGDEADRALVHALVRDCDAHDALLDKPAIEKFAALFDDDDIPLLPAVLANRYRILERIGSGGMAVVFRAYDATLDRDVAIKVMRESAPGSAYNARFLSEIRTTTRLTHPHIVPVFDSGEAEGALYFVMPYCDGGSLADRLKREGRLTTADVQTINSDVASALDYAHAAGFVHRDIKPSNILFSGGRALLSDFGIARLMETSEAKLTVTGIVVGTPEYMSPEQRRGERHPDARSDLYSLGCVVYEMLAGEAAPSSSTRENLARHGVEAVPPLIKVRPELPSAVARCLSRAMALEASQRFGSAKEFGEALAASLASPVERVDLPGGNETRRSVQRAMAVGMVAVVVGALGIAAFNRGGVSARATSQVGLAVEQPPNAPPPLDSARFAVFPYEGGDSAQLRGQEDRFVGALRRWDGVRIADRIRLQELLTISPPGMVGSEQARAIARELSAGRFIRRGVVRSASGHTVTASLYGTSNGALLREASVDLPSDSAAQRSAFAALVAHLLFDARDADSTRLSRDTRSRPALQLFDEGMAAIHQWDLARADSAFVAASQLDTSFASARLWIAQVRIWRGMPSAAWNFEATHAFAQRSRLAAQDRLSSEIVEMYGRGDTAQACARWSRSAERSIDFSAWYGAAQCEMRDRAVVRDRSSPSGWRFRSSYAHASKALRRAFEIMPAIHRQFRSSWYWDLGRRLNISPSQVRVGYAQAPDTGMFAAYPSWSARGDSLVFVPMRIAEFAAQGARNISPSRGEAVQQQRRLFKEIATAWHAAYPQSADAMLALTIALDELGDLSALDSVAVARGLATDSSEIFRTAAAQVWLWVKHGIPGNLRALERAKALADSLLRLHPSPRGEDVAAYSALAMLVGHVAQSAAYARFDLSDDELTPGTLRSAGQALLAFAAAGGPADSIRVLAKQVQTAIAGAIGEKQRAGVMARWLGRPVTLAFPAVQLPIVKEIADGGDVLADAESGWLVRDTVGVFAKLRSIRENRRFSSPEDLKLEAAIPEAWLLASLGDSASARARLAAPLDAQDRASAEALSGVTGAGSLIRAMALRAALEQGSRNVAESARWARAVLTLWSDADRDLQLTVLKEMRLLAR